MAKVVELKDAAKVHLKGLASEINTLIGHARPEGKGLPIKCWSTNSQDVSVALTVLQAVSLSHRCLSIICAAPLVYCL